MKRTALMTWPQVAALAAVITLLATAFALRQRFGPRAVTVTAGTGPEELVFVRSSDDIIDGGAIFMPPKGSAKPIAVIWIHGWGVNFYHPTYVQTGRATAALGYTFISANTRMHDLGNVAGWRGEKRIRGGGYWGVADEEVRDLAAWVALAEQRGFKKVILVGHSAGWAAVRSYQSEEQDSRVVGVVLASGAVRAETRPTDLDQLAEAKRLMAAGEADALIRDPKRSFPSYISAATFLAIANAPAEYKDFFGVEKETVNPGVTRIRCPLLAFFGDRGDVGGESDLKLLKSSIQRQSNGPSRVDTVTIHNADHMYTGEEAQVARTIAEWADSVVLSQTGSRDIPSEHYQSIAMKHALWGVAAVGCLYSLHRLALWAERRGWIYYSKRRGSSGALGSALLEVQAIMEPSKRFVLEERRKDDSEPSESGDPPRD